MDFIGIENLELSGFRQFERRAFSFDPRLSCLVGENGSGKSSVLEAASVVLGRLVSFATGANPRPLGHDDRRSGVRESLDQAVEVSSVLNVGGIRYDLRCSLSPSGKLTFKHSPRLRARFAVNELTALPVFAFYRSGRLWYEPPVETPPPTRLRAYHAALDPASVTGELPQWMSTVDQSSTVRQAFLEAAQTVLALDSPMDVAIERGQVVLKTPAGRLPLRQHADGLRSLALLALDLAWRMCVLNPHLGHLAVRGTPGIVILDEIDLHLHPRWQRIALRALNEAFPSIQMLTSTHSPFVVQELERGQLLTLDGRSSDPIGALEDIAEGVMGVEQAYQSARRQRLLTVAAEFFDALDAGVDTAALEAALDESIRPITSDAAALAYLRAEMLARRDRRS